MLICLAFSDAATPQEKEVAQARTNGYILGYRQAQSNLAPIIAELTDQIGILQVAYSNQELIYQEVIKEKDLYHSNQMANFSNFHSNFTLYTKAKGEQKRIGSFWLGFGLGTGLTSTIFLVKEQVSVEGSLINIKF